VPAAAVIPAPIAYIKVVAVKKLLSRPLLVGWGIMYFTLKKSECFRQAFA